MLNTYLIKLSDSLEAEEIDSIIVFSTALPGSSSHSNCDTGMLVISFAIWTKDSRTHIRQVRGVWTPEIINDTLHLFDYFQNKRDTLESEIFMPVILSAQRNRDSSITFWENSIAHEPNYSFYFKIHEYKKSFHFCESFLESDEGLFKHHNLSLLVHRRRQSIKA